MADDVVLPGTGDTIAADEIVGKKFQRMKLTIGADGANDGDVSAENPVPAIDNRAAMLLMHVSNSAWAASTAMVKSTTRCRS